MGDINLLENQLANDITIRYRQYFLRARFILFIALIVLLLAGGGLLVWVKSAEKKQAQAETSVAQKGQELVGQSREKRDAAVAVQGQLQALQQLLPAHPYWSQAFNSVDEAVIPGVQFTGLSTATNSTMVLNGVAKDYDTLAAFTKKLKDVQYIQQVVLNSSSLSDTPDNAYYRFTLTVAFDPKVLKFQDK
jgi:Tfp pilus assembly protein PilN